MIRWTADARQAISAISHMEKKLHGGYFGKSIEAAQRNIVEKNVKARFDANSTRDPGATKKGPGIYSQQIKDSITTSKPIFEGHVWKVGTGNVKELDKIIVGFGPAKASLWRILEKGAKSHDIVPSQAPLLQFYWYRYGFWRITDKVTHPGQTGRHYFLTVDDAIYDSDKAVKEQIRKAFERIVKQFSYR